MAEYTEHGQYIPGTGGVDPETQPEIAEGCEGRFRCSKCAREVNDARFGNRVFERYNKALDDNK